MTPESKMCSGCRRILPTADFTMNRRTADGRCAYCKVCDRDRHRLLYAQTAERRRIMERTRQRRLRARAAEAEELRLKLEALEAENVALKTILAVNGLYPSKVAA